MLTIEEIDILIDALGAWEQSGFAGALMGSMLSSVVAESKEEVEKISQDYMEEAAQESKKKKETSILLKAKLIGMKDKIVTSGAASFLESGGE